MASNLRTQAGPWCGSLTDTSVRSAQACCDPSRRRGRSSPKMPIHSQPPRVPGGEPVVRIPSGSTGIESPRSTLGLKPGDRTISSAWSWTETRTRHSPGASGPPAALNSASGFSFALSGCAKPLFSGGVRPEAYKAIAAMPDLLFFFHLGDFHYAEHRG